MDDSVLIRLFTPFHNKVKIKGIAENKNKSVARIINESPIQNEIFNPSFTKITARRGKIHRKLFKGDNYISVGLLKRLNKSGLILSPRRQA